MGKVLGYLDRHVPVIASDRGAHGQVCDSASGVVSNDPEVWVARGAALLADPDARAAMARAAFTTFSERLSAQAAAAQLAAILNAERASPPAPPV